MSDPKKCEHPTCSCTVPSGESFCSAACEAAKGTIDIVCQCGHPGCRGEALRS